MTKPFTEWTVLPHGMRTRIERMRTIKDKAAFRDQLERWAKLDIVVTQAPSATLHQLAEKLAA